VRRLAGLLLIFIGIAVMMVVPVALYYLAGLACGMNSTGCRAFDTPWYVIAYVAALYLVPVVLLSAGLIWGGVRLRRPRDQGSAR
jgi:hypothetical protein